MGTGFPMPRRERSAATQWTVTRTTTDFSTDGRSTDSRAGLPLSTRRPVRRDRTFCCWCRASTESTKRPRGARLRSPSASTHHCRTATSMVRPVLPFIRDGPRRCRRSSRGAGGASATAWSRQRSGASCTGCRSPPAAAVRPSRTETWVVQARTGLPSGTNSATSSRSRTRVTRSRRGVRSIRRS
jgi:hypothetical protein